MNIDLESCFVGFLIGFAIYLLVNRVFMVEGIDFEVKDQDTCQRACESLDQTLTCEWKPGCAMEGCNIGGFGQNCRACSDNYPCSSPSQSPSQGPSLTPDQAQDRLQDIIDKVTGGYQATWEDYDPMPRLCQTYTKFNFNGLSASEFTDFTTLLSSSNGRFLSLNDKSPFLYIIGLNLSQAVQLVNCFKDDIQGLHITLNDDEQDLSAITLLNNKDNFKMLDINNDELLRMTGKLTDLNEFTKLVFLNLANTNITDKISNLSLSGLTQLQFLGMTGDESWQGGLNGDIGHIKNLTKLRYLDFGGNPGITGNINQLSGLTELRRLDLSDTGVSGDINDLQSLINLTYVSLCPSGVHGNIFDSTFAKNLYMNPDKYDTDFDDCLNIKHPNKVDCSDEYFNCIKYSCPTQSPTNSPS
jgi:hypothetical protein